MQQSLGNNTDRVSTDIKTHQAAYSLQHEKIASFLASVRYLLGVSSDSVEYHRVKILIQIDSIKYVKVGHSHTSFPHCKLGINKAKPQSHD